MAGYEREGRKPGKRIEYQAQRKARRSLAHRLREDFSDEEISYWLGEVMAGRDPDAKLGADGKALPGIMQEPPNWNHRMRAAQMMLNRRNGLAATHVTIEQEIKGLVGVAHVSVPAAVMARMDLGVLADVRGKLRQLISGAQGASTNVPESVPDVLPAGTSIIDTTSTEDVPADDIPVPVSEYTEDP